MTEPDAIRTIMGVFPWQGRSEASAEVLATAILRALLDGGYVVLTEQEKT